MTIEIEKKSFSGIEGTQETIASILLAGGVGVFPTDTLYGLVGSALHPSAIERIYQIRKRELTKPLIVLISSIDDLKFFGAVLNSEQEKKLKKIWPGKVSLVLPCENKKIHYLLRGGKTLAFRLPAEKNILNLIKKVGPLVAPSANLAGEAPAETFLQAKKYFNEEIDFYVDFGRISSEPSTLIALDEKGEVELLRKGAVDISKL
ncbi:MAG: hypothetical protein ACD_56C00097G0007 [uncultured bacterium]|nr:MAG: hypothetical protein ACD_56C00097G0007 [uncultured bacterium]